MTAEGRTSIDAGVNLLDPRNVGQFDPSSEGVRLGFGCAGLMQLPSRRARQRLLNEAFERGIAHFDVARMYGLGMAEAELGRFVAGRRREQVTIATKFGIDPGSPRMARLQAPARFALARVPALRTALKRRGEGPREPRRYDAGGARASLETSLRELGTDYVDVLFVHDPGRGDQVDLEGIGELCEELVERGAVRAWGLSGDPDPCVDFAAGGFGSVLQVRDEILAPIADSPALPPRFGFGVLAEALPRIQGHLAEPERRRRWSAATGRDCGSAEVLASLLLADALERNRGGGVLVATTRPERLAAPAALAGRVAAGNEEPGLSAFRECVRADFGIPGS
ncbi:MAG: aldo/keto reductase [Solirubrobacterales bacterium]